MVRLTESVLASRPLVVLVGPTAVGKSEIGLRLARSLETDLLTADSRQVYRGMDVATDKPTVTQRQGCRIASSIWSILTGRLMPGNIASWPCRK